MKVLTVLLVSICSLQLSVECRADDPIELAVGDKFIASDAWDRTRIIYITDVGATVVDGKVKIEGSFDVEWAGSASDSTTNQFHPAKGTFTGSYKAEPDAEGHQEITFSSQDGRLISDFKATKPEFSGYLKRPDAFRIIGSIIGLQRTTNGDNNVVAVLATVDHADGGTTEEAQYVP